VVPLKEGLSKLSGNRAPAVCRQSQEYFRDVYDHLLRISGSIDAIRDTIGTAIQVSLSLVTIEDSEVTKRLAAWAAILAPVPALGAIWGMNFHAMPELGWIWGYPLALAVMLGTCVFLYYRFKVARWL
jgi:magnesium transporter